MSQPTLLASRKKFNCYLDKIICQRCANISLIDGVAPTLFAVLEAALMPSIRRTQPVVRDSTTTFHLGSKRVVSELSARIQVMSAHGEFDPVN